MTIDVVTGRLSLDPYNFNPADPAAGYRFHTGTMVVTEGDLWIVYYFLFFPNNAKQFDMILERFPMQIETIASSSFTQNEGEAEPSHSHTDVVLPIFHTGPPQREGIRMGQYYAGEIVATTSPAGTTSLGSLDEFLPYAGFDYPHSKSLVIGSNGESYASPYLGDTYYRIRLKVPGQPDLVLSQTITIQPRGAGGWTV